MPRYKEFEVRTDTACLAVFDDDVIGHRLADDCDWWTDPSAELEEMRAGNMMLVHLAGDGTYRVRVLLDGRVEGPSLRALVRSRAGEIRIAPGESLPGEDLWPDSGLLLEREPGTYEVLVGLLSEREIVVSVVATDGEARNELEHPLRLRLGSTP